MSQLLHRKFDLVERNRTIHKDRIIHGKKDVKSIKKRIDKKLNEIMRKPYFKNRRLTKDKLEKVIYLELKNELKELEYITEHFRYKPSTIKYTNKCILDIKETIEKMVNIGIEF